MRAKDLGKNVKRIGIFLSSPGDLTAERDAVSQVCSEINLDHGRQEGYVIDLIRWETHAWSARGDYGQAVLNKQLGVDFDIYLGMLWSKFGTQTEHWRSGTEEEFRIALALNEQAGSPEMMFFFSDTPIPPSAIRPDQVTLIGAFRKELQDIGILHFSFSNSIDLKVLVRRHILASINNIIKEEGAVENQDQVQPDVPLSDPLSNWNELLATDSEVNFVHLLEVATEQLNISGQLINKIASDTRRVTASLAKSTKKLRNSSGAPKNALGQQISAIETIADALSTYARHLRTDISKLYDSYDTSATSFQRSLDVASVHLPNAVPMLARMIPAMRAARTQSEQFRTTVLETAELLSKPIEYVPTVALQTKKVSALQRDLANFLEHSTALMSDLEKRIQEAEQQAVGWVPTPHSSG